MRIKFPSKLKHHILAHYIISMLIICVVIGLCVTITTNYIVKSRINAHYMQTMEYVGGNVEKELDDINEISDYLFVNNDVKRVVENYESRNYEYVNAYDMLDTLLKQNVLSNVFNNLNAVVIISDQQIVYKYVKDFYYREFDAKAITESTFYKQAMEQTGMVISGQAYSNTYSEDNDHTISVFRSVLDDRYSQNIGGIFLSFELDGLEESQLTITRESAYTTYLVDVEGNVLTDSTSVLPEGIHEQIMQGYMQNEFFSFEDRTNELLVFCYPLSEYSCYVLGTVPISQTTTDMVLISVLFLAAVLVSIALSFVVWRYLERRILRPLNRISASLMGASQGEYRLIDDYAGNSIEEIRTLVNNYNKNVTRIDDLINELSEEKTIYKDLEYKALQAQINSHFITNTLNTIRWLAIIQKADNIKDVIDAFSRLLKSTWQGLGSDSTLGGELSNVKDYIFIQQITHSYKCQVYYDIDESIMDQHCIKFIIQPLVENAFFHGIAPKEGSGIIRISIKRSVFADCPAAEIIVWDNGVGIEKEKQRQMLEGKERIGQFNGIGINNIHERLQLKYGVEYGVFIESQVGCYTKMSVYIPLEQKGGE